MLKQNLPAGFVVPAQPVEREVPPSGADWVHEITDFEALRHRGAGDLAVLYAFDLIELDGDDLRSLPIETRKATLASLLRKPGALRLSEHIAADGLRVFAHACRLGAEGIVSKRLGSSYRSGPCQSWIKCKNPEAIAAQRDRAAGWIW
jgi:bifunctional non-homologous end joining protein LigD